MNKLTIVVMLVVLSSLVCGLQTAYADVPHLINFQGRIADTAGNPITGTRSITFNMYDAEGGGNLLWHETHPNITVTDGIFEVLIGSVSSLDLPFDKQYYLGIQVGSDPEMTPRQKIASVGYAYKAEKAEYADSAATAAMSTTATNADTVDGVHVSSTPEANRLVALDASGKFPYSTIPANLNTVSKGAIYDTEEDAGSYSWADCNSTPIIFSIPADSIGFLYAAASTSGVDLHLRLLLNDTAIFQWHNPGEGTFARDFATNEIINLQTGTYTIKWQKKKSGGGWGKSSNKRWFLTTTRK